MENKPGSILGGALLIGGSCLGAGMLALPLTTGLSGFFPSLFMLIVVWGFMTLTGLLMVEANGWFDKQVNIISMAAHSLGRFGKVFLGLLYLFLFYSLLIAYISGSGSLISSYMAVFFNFSLPPWASSLFFVLLFGVVAYQGTRLVDHWNRVLMVGKILAYVGMVFLGVSHINPSFLLYTEPRFSLLSIPVLIVAFGYHNMIPTLTAYMQGDLGRVRKTILTGSCFGLVIYLIWEILVLGIVPLEGKWGIIASFNAGRQASDAVAGVLGISWVSTFAEALAFFALLTSFLAQTLALIHFLADAVNRKEEKQESLGLCLLALIPPLGFSLLYPDAFIKALNFAGGVCAVILFGLFPSLMVWKGRYQKNFRSSYQVMGGKPLLISLFLFSLFVLFFQISSMLIKA